MTALVTRTGKGGRITTAEMDANLNEIDRRSKAGWRDLVADMTARGGANSPTLALYSGGIYLYEFVTNDTQEVFANFHVDHDFERGTMLYPHVHFTTQSALAGVVRWGFEYTWARRNASTGQRVFPATTTSYSEFSVPANSQGLHMVAELAEGAGIDGTDIEPDVMIMMRIFRDGQHANDTFDASVFGITVDLHYQADRLTTPNRAPDFYAVG